MHIPTVLTRITLIAIDQNGVINRQAKVLQLLQAHEETCTLGNIIID